MNIILNNTPTPLPDGCMSVADLIEWKGIKTQGTAVAVNDKIVKKEMWSTAFLSPMDRVIIISAAFGG